MGWLTPVATSEHLWADVLQPVPRSLAGLRHHDDGLSPFRRSRSVADPADRDPAYGGLFIDCGLVFSCCCRTAFPEFTDRRPTNDNAQSPDMSVRVSASGFLVGFTTDRIASSLPAIGTVIKSGSAFVSTIATIGTPSLFASLTAMRS